MRRLSARAAGVLGVVALAVLTPTTAASAHPLGNFTVNRYTGVLVSPNALLIDHVMDLAEVPTAQLGDRLDDLPALAHAECDDAVAQLGVTAGGDRVTLRVATSSATTTPGQGGLPITRITCRFDGSLSIPAGGTTIEVTDRANPGQIGWREITAVGDRVTFISSTVPAQSTSDRLT